MQRRLSAILVADVVGYSRLMGRDERGTLEALRRHRLELLEPKVTSHGGRIVKLMGDGALVEFASAVEAVACGIDIQVAMRERNADVPQDDRIVFRMGINIGDVIIDEQDIYGDGVNIAARLEELADPGGIFISRNVRNQMRDKLDLTLEDRGETDVKNIARPVRVFSVALDKQAEALAATPRTAPAARTAYAPEHGGLRGFLIPAAFVLFALTLGVGGWYVLRTGGTSAGLSGGAVDSGRPSIAVLPFDNLSDDAEQEYFADGLTDDLITDLSKISGLVVIARNSVFVYKERADDVRAIANELGVRYVIDGSVRQFGEALRINAQLIDGTTGDNLWAERYDRDRADIFEIQDEMIAAIIDALAIKLTDAERTDVARPPTSSLEAYDYYLRGEKLTYNAEPASADHALRTFQQAIALDPNFADAYAGYARVAVDVLGYNFANSLPSAVARKRAYDAAGKALALDPRSARSYSVLALLQMLDSQHENALASARRAVALAPNDADAHLNLAVVQVYAGQSEEALVTMERVFKLNPKPPAHVHDYYALALFMNGRYADALAVLDKNPVEAKSDLRFELLAATKARLGHIEAARAEVDEVLKTFPGHSISFYRVLLQHHARPEDREARLEAQRLAGLPEWPFAFHGESALRLDRAEIAGLADGHTWVGEIVGQGGFTQFSQDGGFVLRGESYQFSGSYTTADDMLCIAAPAILMGRKDCGPVYRNAEDDAGTADYTYANAYGLKRFSIDP